VIVIGIGYVLHDQLDRVVGWFRALGGAAIPVVVGTIVAYWFWRIAQKRRVIRALRGRRLTADALWQRLATGDPVRIIDLRTAIDFGVTRRIVPGAIRMDPEDLDARHREIPRDCDVVLYCTCPNETTSARVALALKKRGIERVFPLEGGMEAWVSRGYPLDLAP
jgi:rhodanese-related sulfurtransferase